MILVTTPMHSFEIMEMMAQEIQMVIQEPD